MSHLRAALLLDSEVARVADVACTAPRSGVGEPEHAPATQLIAPRRGVFFVHRGRDVAVADPTTAVLLRADEDYRVSHPVDGGDRCTSISVAADVAEEVFGRRPSGAIRLAPGGQLALGLVAGALAPGGAEAGAASPAESLAAEEAALLALEAVAADAPPRASAPGRRRVRDVCALLAADPARAWRLADVSRAVHTSPFHLARQFRAGTGDSIGGHLLRLRLGLALDRLADGDTDLGRLGIEAGFAHHSHFTARFRATFGITPAQARGAKAAELRTILTAAAPAQT
jgi:AraC-like DNA-binding protein